MFHRSADVDPRRRGFAGFRRFPIRPRRIGSTHGSASRATFAVAAVGELACCVCASGPVAAQEFRPDFAVTDGSVRATAVAGNTLYLGGDFTLVGMPTGSGVPIDAATGEPLPGFPVVQGQVLCAVSDGANGWYLSGSFTTVGGHPRTNLAHVKADLSVTPWSPQVDNWVECMVLYGERLYVGGRFTQIDGQPRAALAAFDAATGQLTDWHPSASSSDGSASVSRMTEGAGVLYVDGDFRAVDGLPRISLAGIDAATGQVTEWDPSAYNVTDLCYGGGVVYACGGFSVIGGEVRAYLAALDPISGLATSWHPTVGGWVVSVLYHDGIVYIGGSLGLVNGAERAGLAAINATTGALTAWNPTLLGQPNELGIHDGNLIVGGIVTEVGGRPRGNLAAIDLATGHVTGWHPYTNNVVLALAGGAGTIYAGGWFNLVGGATRHSIAAIDLTTGVPTPWNPSADGVVRALVVDGQNVIVGGDFTHIGGQARDSIAAIDVTTGQATAWNPNASDNAQIHVLALRPGSVYVGGQFLNIGGKVRNNLAELNPTTGQATAWNPDCDGLVRSIALGPQTVYVGGHFFRVGGATRNSLAALDAASGLATSWDPSGTFHPHDVYALAWSIRGTIYAGGTFQGIGGIGRNGLAEIGVRSGKVTPWSPSLPTYSGVLAIVPVPGTVYIGGGFRSVGGEARQHLAAIDAVTGMPTPWTVSCPTTVASLALHRDWIYTGMYVGQGFTPLSDGIEAIQLPAAVAALVATSSVRTTAGCTSITWTLTEPVALNRLRLLGRSEAQPWEVPLALGDDGRTAASDCLPASPTGSDISYRLELDRGDGAWIAIWEESVAVGSTARRVELGMPHPNPFNPRVVIPYALGRGQHVELAIYDVAGREVVRLADGQRPGGAHEAVWTGLDARGRPVPSGQYLVRLRAEGSLQSRKLMLVR